MFSTRILLILLVASLVVGLVLLGLEVLEDWEELGFTVAVLWILEVVFWRSRRSRSGSTDSDDWDDSDDYGDSGDED